MNKYNKFVHSIYLYIHIKWFFIKDYGDIKCILTSKCFFDHAKSYLIIK